MQARSWESFIEIAYELLESAERHQQPSTHALRSHISEAMGLPLEYDASDEGNLFESLSTDPERLQLDSFLYGLAHQCHLASEVKNFSFNFLIMLNVYNIALIHVYS